MIGAVSAEIWLAAAYGVFLLGVAHLLDVTARRAAHHTARSKNPGFVYHEHHDAWQCPEDQWLWPQAFDPENRVMRYRANPVVCNTCPVKATCTSGYLGKEITRHVDPWPAAEAERFHRGIACTVVVLGALWPLASMLGHRTSGELVVLAITVVVIAAGSWPLWSHLRRSPARFPDSVLTRGVKVLGLDESDAQAQAAATAQARWRAGYASDRRTEEDPK